ncbi:MAG TPA: sulfurtransferase [Methanomicrobiales archaeon]|nr:sulfurtransferase [Methanomicrobiales archaeon]
MPGEQPYPYPPGEGEVKWVSTAWLSDHLKDPGLQIVDCQPNIHDYIRGHIPGALFIEENHWRLSRDRPGVFLPPEMAEILLRRLGIRPGEPVVVASSSGPLSVCTTFIGDGLEQTMLAYTLARYGHRQVYILDGGVDKWQQEGRPLSQAFPKVTESEFRVQLRKDFFIEYGDVKAMKDRPGVMLLDARPSAVYEGQGPWPKPGHIPGAVSLPWKSLMDPKNAKLLKPEEEIRVILAERKITPDKTIICSCGTGREATNEFCLFTYFLKFPKVRLYEGSFTEWTMYPDNPTVTGKNPR